MTKYTIMTELVNAGCDLDKLPKVILEAIENACLNGASIKADNAKMNSNTTADASAKLMGAITTLSTCVYCERAARHMSEYVLRKEYMPAQKELTTMAFYVKGDEKLEKAYRTAGEMIGYLAVNQ